jgi:Cu+-exporting ATPase
MKVLFAVSNILAILLLMMACGDVKEQVQDQNIEIEVVKNENIIEDGEAKTLASLSIEGMSCEKMCAGLINEKLSNLEGVKSCNIDFESKVASVEFDDEKLNEDKMIETIRSLNDGQYSVSKVEINKTIVKEIEIEEKDEEESKETAYLDQDGTAISFFNIFDVISRIY